MEETISRSKAEVETNTSVEVPCFGILVLGRKLFPNEDSFLTM